MRTDPYYHYKPVTWTLCGQGLNAIGSDDIDKVSCPECRKRFACEHHDFFAQVNIARIEDLTPIAFYADVTIKCTECNLPFHFVGVSDFGLSPDKPCLNPDSTELRCPIRPGQAEFMPERMSFGVPQ